MCVRPVPIRPDGATAAARGCIRDAAAGCRRAGGAQLITPRLGRSAKKRYICTPWRENAAAAIRKQTYNN